MKNDERKVALICRLFFYRLKASFPLLTPLHVPSLVSIYSPSLQPYSFFIFQRSHNVSSVKTNKHTSPGYLSLTIVFVLKIIYEELKHMPPTSKCYIYKLKHAIVLTGYKMLIVLFLCNQNYYIFDKLKAVDNMIDDVFRRILLMFQGGREPVRFVLLIKGCF